MLYWYNRLMDVASHPYRAVALAIAAQIDRGEFELNPKLPSVRTLAKEQGVSPVTAQRALAHLADIGYAVASPVGYHVAPESSRKRPLAKDANEQIAALRAKVGELETRLAKLEGQAGE